MSKTDSDAADIEVEVDRTVEMEGHTEHVPEDVLNAVREAFEQTIGHIVFERSVYWHAADSTGHLARFTFNYPEMPVGPGEWVPPYRTREKVREDLVERLPDGVRAEAKNSSTTTLYEEVGY